MWLFALRLIYSRNHPSYAKCKVLSSERFESLLLGVDNTQFILLLFSKRQIDTDGTGSVKLFFVHGGHNGRVRNPALLSSFYSPALFITPQQMSRRCVCCSQLFIAVFPQVWLAWPRSIFRRLDFQSKHTHTHTHTYQWYFRKQRLSHFFRGR